MKERHEVFSSLEPTIFNTSKVLIMGSAPGEDTIEQRKVSGNNDYYYDKKNKFWDILEKKYKLEPYLKYKDYEYKTKILEKYKIALWDILSYCTREGSSDKTIKNPQYDNDILGYLKKYPNIKRIIINGKGNEKWFNKYLKDKNISINIEIKYLVSTSGSYWDCQPKTERDKWYMYLPD